LPNAVEMSTEPFLPPDSVPGLVRRGAAKAIDFIGVGFTVVGFASVTHSYLTGLLIGYTWLAFSDWSGSPGKWIMKLEVHDRGTGGPCSAWASVLRNLPMIAFTLPHRLHQALLGMDRQEYRHAYPAVILSMGCLALITLVAMIAVASRNGERRHMGDYLARTVVISRKSSSEPEHPASSE